MVEVSGQRRGDVLAAESLDIFPAAASSCSSIGEQKIAVILISYPNQPLRADLTVSTVKNLMFGSYPSLDGYLRESSYSRTFATGDVFGPFTTSKSFVCIPSVPSSAALRDEVIRAVGNIVDFTVYTKILAITPYVSDCVGDPAQGQSDTSCLTFTLPNGKTGFATFSQVTLNPNRPPSAIQPTIFHEIGHSLGYPGHASGLAFNGVTLGGLSDPGMHDEYGDRFATMGGSVCDPSGRCTLGHFTAQDKIMIGWLDANTDIQVVFASGTYTVTPMSAGGGIKSLKILRPGTSRWLWVEYRQPVGYDATLNLLSPQSFSGALIRYEPSPGYENGTLASYSHLLDFHPSTVGDFSDAMLLVGETWSDPFSALSIKVVSGTAAGLTVQVTSPGNPTQLPAKVTVTGAVNAASFQPGLSPGELATINGTNLADAVVTNSAAIFPTILGTTQVLLQGKPVPLSYVSPTQINLQIPTDVALGGPQNMQVVHAGVTSNNLIVSVFTLAPGVFQYNGRGIVTDQNYRLITQSNPVRPGSGYYTLWTTGLGPTDCTLVPGQPSTGPCYVNASVSLQIGPDQATVQYAGLAPGFPGLYQVNFQVPGSDTGRPEQLKDCSLHLGPPGVGGTAVFQLSVAGQ